MKPSALDTSTYLCHWCKGKADDSPYRSPLEVVGGRWVVCSPQCPERPEGVRVITAKVGSYANYPSSKSI